MVSYYLFNSIPTAYVLFIAGFFLLICKYLVIIMTLSSIAIVFCLPESVFLFFYDKNDIFALYQIFQS